MNDTLEFLKKRFSDYYKEANLYLPDRFGKREWGFMFLGEGFMKRHMAFQNREGLRDFLVNKIPAHVYHSAAYYEKPNASTMQEKNWLGADLIFDLDADHIKGAEGMTYEETLQKVKEEFIRLIDDFLLDDFGFSQDQLEIIFSGGRGYHIHIRDPRVIQLSSHERREIVDYITGKEVDMELIFPETAYDKKTYIDKKTSTEHVTIKKKVMMPEEDAGGWKKKMREGMRRLTDELENIGKAEAIKRLCLFEGIGEKTAKGIYIDLFEGPKGERGVDRMWGEENLEIFSSDKHQNFFLLIVKGEIGIKMEGDEGQASQESIESLIVKEKLEGETDEPVTSDIRRLIRLPSSLHGKTGFVVKPLSRDELNDFEPLRDAVCGIFSDDPIKIEVTKPVNIKLKNEVFNLKEGEAEVPEFAAIFLLCRKNAQIPQKT
ncbi:MAG: DNA primase catalytic subunit PriS [Thermoplasmata archaeon]|nr:MAG: DNA primase catalytic subunit PriS [Thermoplasmata archaeon]